MSLGGFVFGTFVHGAFVWHSDRMHESIRGINLIRLEESTICYKKTDSSTRSNYNISVIGYHLSIDLLLLMDTFKVWFLFQIRIYDTMLVIIISNSVLYFERPGIDSPTSRVSYGIMRARS